MNERKTENIVRNKLKELGYYNQDVIIEEQKSDNPKIQKLLKNASKTGNAGGRPEFIIRSKKYSQLLIIIECKADIKKHESKEKNKYSQYAVDGVLLYASFLSKEYDILAIAISGETKAELNISHFLYLKGSDKAVEFKNVNDILSFEEYYKSYLQSDIKFKQDYDALLDYSRKLNILLQEKKITESIRGLLISGILIALNNESFKISYKSQNTGIQLARDIIGTIISEFENAKITKDRIEYLSQSFSFISSTSSLIEDKEFFINLIQDIDENINSFIKTHKYYDTIGQFYVEFLRYANNDKGLGIVLTPPHIAELFSGLAGIDKNSIVFDNCCGTAGLLISAMKTMIQDAKSNESEIQKIKNSHLYGIEYQEHIYALAVSNMILHGDGKTNIFRGDCFVDFKTLNFSPNIGLLNPPYKNKKSKTDKEELEFVYNNLERISPKGKCVAIVPITCSTAPKGEIFEWKKKLLENHTLEAVLSMPIELFHNSKVNVVTCIMVFTAHVPHKKGYKTWFGYCRDDGFIKTKHKGRIDLYGKWDKIKENWLNTYRNRSIINGFSVMKEVGAEGEWCAEAYLPIDYNLITEENLISSVIKFFLNKTMILHKIRVGDSDEID